MSKKLFCVVSIITSLLFTKDSYALTDSTTPCSSLGYNIFTTTTDPDTPTTPKATEIFTIHFVSPDIKKGTTYHFKIRTEDALMNNSVYQSNMRAENDGLIIFSKSNLKLPSGSYRIRLFTEWEQFKCVSNPFSIDRPEGAPLPTDFCYLNAKIENKKIILSGSGTLKTQTYIPYINRVDGGQVPLGKEITIKSDGSFGPEEYPLPQKYAGGISLIGIMHSYARDVRCTAEADIPKTLAETPPCKNRDDPTFKKGDIVCTSSAGVSCDPDNFRMDSVTNLPIPGEGVFTAIGCVPTNPTKLIESLLKLATGIGGGVALLLFVYGAFQMITSGGNPEGVKKGHEQMTSAIIGLLFIIFSVMLLKIIGVDILQIPGFQ